MSRNGRLTSPGSSQPIDLTDPNTPISLLEAQWRSFADERIPLACSDAQRATMETAFYAGARGLLNVVDGAFAEGLPGEEVGKVLPAIAVEIERWADRNRAANVGKIH